MEHRPPEESIIETLPLLGAQGRYSGLQLHFLQRLHRLLRLRNEQGSHLNAEGVRLLDRTIYSIYCDCVGMDISGEAQQLLRRFPVPSADRSDT
jgi:hypothetical protein